MFKIFRKWRKLERPEGKTRLAYSKKENKDSVVWKTLENYYSNHQFQCPVQNIHSCHNFWTQFFPNVLPLIIQFPPFNENKKLQVQKVCQMGPNFGKFSKFFSINVFRPHQKLFFKKNNASFLFFCKKSLLLALMKKT